MPTDTNRGNGLDSDLAMALARDLDFRIRRMHQYDDRGIVTLLLNGRGILRIDENYALFVTSAGGIVRVYYCRIIEKLADHPSQCPKNGHYLGRDSDGNEIWWLDGPDYNYASTAEGSGMFGVYTLRHEDDLEALSFITVWRSLDQ